MTKPIQATWLRVDSGTAVDWGTQSMVALGQGMWAMVLMANGLEWLGGPIISMTELKALM